MKRDADRIGINKTPRSWAYNSKEEFFLLRAYVHFLEMRVRSAAENFEEYLKTEETVLTQELQDGTVQSSMAEVRLIEGTTEIDFDLPSLLTKTFPAYERRSLLITIYGIFEYQLTDFCKKMEVYKKISPSFDKVGCKKGRPPTIKMAQSWLTKYAGLDLSSTTSVFEEINKIREIRNWAAHNYGLIDKKKSKKDVVDYVNQHKMIEVDGLRFEIKEGFLRHFTDLCHQFFGQLEKSVKSL